MMNWKLIEIAKRLLTYIYKGVKRMHGVDKYGRHIFDDDRKRVKRVHDKDKGSGMMTGNFLLI